MLPTHIVNVDLAKIYGTATKKGLITTLAWGDEVELIALTDKHVEILLTHFEPHDDGSIEPVTRSGFIVPAKSSKIKPADTILPINQQQVLKVDFVDVQQGDAAVVETPQGQVMIIDGGDNQLFARYLANRYRNTSADNPKTVECIVVSHGDADHFAGLSEILDSETHPLLWKRIFIHPERVYHNGLVKRPDSVKETEQFGATLTKNKVMVITELEDDLRTVADVKMNGKFQDWKKALKTYTKRGPITIRRVEKGQHDAFDFLKAEGIKVEVLGPILTEIDGQRGLRFLGDPPDEPHVGLRSLEDVLDGFSGKSASHTINGHSIILRLQYGDFRFLFAGDLNEQAEVELLLEQQANNISLRSEIFKVPHHGSAEFLPQFIEAVAPVVSVISCGDENGMKEYIHPRATLVGSLGKYSRLAEPIIFITELVAFFKVEGWVRPEFHKVDDDDNLILKNGKVQIDNDAQDRGWFFAFSRTAFGIVKVRTDGQRLLVYTNSGQARLKEAYAFTSDPLGDPIPTTVRQV